MPEQRCWYCNQSNRMVALVVADAEHDEYECASLLICRDYLADVRRELIAEIYGVQEGGVDHSAGSAIIEVRRLHVKANS